MNGKGYFNEIKKEICHNQLFSKPHNYFSTKSPHTSTHFRQRCTSFWNPSTSCFVTQICLPQFSIFEPPYPASYCTHINTLITINGLHSSVNFNWRTFFRGWEFNNSTLFEPNTWKIFHFDVHWVRTVSICVFKVKYDGREIPCDYTELVLPRYV